MNLVLNLKNTYNYSTLLYRTAQICKLYFVVFEKASLDLGKIIDCEIFREIVEANVMSGYFNAISISLW